MKHMILAAAALAAVLLAALPAAAATPTVKGTVGPGFTITMAPKPAKSGTIKLVVSDVSNIHNFRLKGPGVNVATGVSATGTRTFTVTLQKGKYTIVCDPHPAVMKSSFTIAR